LELLGELFPGELDGYQSSKPGCLNLFSADGLV